MVVGNIELKRLMSIVYLFPAFLLFSCTTYTIPKRTLVEQLVPIDSTQLISRIVKGPVGTRYEYLANPISDIACLDKKGQTQRLMNSPSIEMRITEVSGKRTIVYFDRTLIYHNRLIGVRSRFAPFTEVQIDLDEIERIEIQDGKKNFKYSN